MYSRELRRVLEILHAQLDRSLHQSSNLKLEGVLVDVRDTTVVADATKANLGQLLSSSVGTEVHHLQVMAILGKFTIPYDIIEQRLSVVGEIKDMKHVVLLLLNHLPAVVNETFQADGFVVLLPTISDQDGVRIWKRNELKLYTKQGARSVYEAPISTSSVFLPKTFVD